MDGQKSLNKRFETIGWGAFFVLIGLDFFVPGTLLPYGIGVFGIGLILLGLNLARRLSGIHAPGFTTLLGVLALIEGGASIARALLDIKIGFPLFAIFLIGSGLYVLARAVGPHNHHSVKTSG